MQVWWLENPISGVKCHQSKQPSGSKLPELWVWPKHLGSWAVRFLAPMLKVDNFEWLSRNPIVKSTIKKNKNKKKQKKKTHDWLGTAGREGHPNLRMEGTPGASSPNWVLLGRFWAKQNKGAGAGAETRQKRWGEYGASLMN